MIDNGNKNPDLRWQYFGSQEGILSLYPAHKFSSCDSYDNRVRPWYVEGIAPEPKDIVLIIDKSGSMEETIGDKTLIEIAISAAESVLNSLNFKDRVSLYMYIWEEFYWLFCKCNNSEFLWNIYLLKIIVREGVHYQYDVLHFAIYYQIFWQNNPNFTTWTKKTNKSEKA